MEWKSSSLLTALLMSSAVSATTGGATPPHDPDGPRGYFWYMETPQEQRKPEKKPQHQPPTMPPHKELMGMHPKEFRAVLKQHREHALHTLNPNDVLNYQKIQDVARRKSTGFAAVTSMVLLQNPHLNAQGAVPTTNPGMSAQRQQVDQSVNQTLQGARGQFALGLFTMPNCTYCQVQKQTLMQFYQRHGWHIKEINAAENRQLTEKFKIQVTPTLIVIKKDTPEWMPVSVGVEALSTIEQNVSRAVRLLLGENQPQQFFMENHERGGFADPLSGGNQ